MCVDVLVQLLPIPQFLQSSKDGDNEPKHELDPCEVHEEVFVSISRRGVPKKSWKESRQYLSLLSWEPVKFLTFGGSSVSACV